MYNVIIFYALIIQTIFVNIGLAMEEQRFLPETMVTSGAITNPECKDKSSLLEDICIDLFTMWQERKFDAITGLRDKLLKQYDELPSVLKEQNFTLPLEIDLIYLASMHEIGLTSIDATDNIRQLLLSKKSTFIKALTVERYKMLSGAIEHYASIFDPMRNALADRQPNIVKFLTQPSDPFFEVGGQVLAVENACLLDAINLLAVHLSKLYNDGSIEAPAQSRIGLLGSISVRLGEQYNKNVEIEKHKDTKHGPLSIFEEQCQLDEIMQFALSILSTAILHVGNNDLLSRELLRVRDRFVARRLPLNVDSAINVVAALAALSVDSPENLIDGLSLPELDGPKNHLLKTVLDLLINYSIKQDDIKIQQFVDYFSRLTTGRQDWEQLWLLLTKTIFTRILTAADDAKIDNINNINILYQLLTKAPSIEQKFSQLLLNDHDFRINIVRFIGSSPSIMVHLTVEGHEKLKYILSWIIKCFERSSNNESTDPVFKLVHAINLFNIISSLYDEGQHNEALENIKLAQKLLGEVRTTKGRKQNASSSRHRPHQGKHINSVQKMQVELDKYKQYYDSVFLFFEAACAAKLDNGDLKRKALIKIVKVSGKGSQREQVDNLVSLLKLLLEETIDEGSIREFLQKRRTQLANGSMGLLIDLAFFALDKIGDENEEKQLFEEILRARTNIKPQVLQPVRKRDIPRLKEENQKKERAHAREKETEKSRNVLKNAVAKDSDKLDDHPFAVGPASTNLKSEYRTQKLPKSNNKRRYTAQTNAAAETKLEDNNINERTSSQVEPFSAEIIEKFKKQNVVHRIFGREAGQIYTGELIRLTALAADLTIDTSRGSHITAKLPHEKPLVFARHKEAKDYQIGMVRRWLEEHGVNMSSEKAERK